MLKKKLKSAKLSVTEVDKVIGLNLRKMRLMNGLSQMDLSKILGLSFQQVQKYERAKNKISAATLYNCSKVLNFPTTEFFANLDEIGANDVVKKDKVDFYVADLFGKIESASIRKKVLDLLDSMGK